MSTQPRVSGREVVKALARAGMTKIDNAAVTSSSDKKPIHIAVWFLTTKKVGKRTLRSIIRLTGPTVEDFKALL